MKSSDVKAFLDEKYEYFNRPDFIESDPISIPHRYARKEDREIAGFLAATISWGNRKSILNNALKLMKLMDDQPYLFIMDSNDRDMSNFRNYVHRTFNESDVLFFIESLRNIYQNYGGLESAFADALKGGETDVFTAIMHFREAFLSVPHLPRSEKHVANPAKGSTAKRINMFLRWMVRKDDRGVDFGIWNRILPSLLCCPLDVHSGRTARSLGILTRMQNDWQAVIELTKVLKSYDHEDPIKYDFALFGIGVENH